MACGRYSFLLVLTVSLVLISIASDLNAKIMGVDDYKRMVVDANGWIGFVIFTSMGAVVIETSLQAYRSLRTLLQHQPKKLHIGLALLLVPALLIIIYWGTGSRSGLDLRTFSLVFALCLVCYGVVKIGFETIFKLKQILWPYHALRPILVFLVFWCIMQTALYLDTRIYE